MSVAKGGAKLRSAGIRNVLRRSVHHLGVCTAASVVEGAIAFGKTGTTPPRAYQDMIEIYCKTRGRSNDVLHQALRFWRRPYRLPEASGVLGELSHREVAGIKAVLERDGYYVFPTRVDEERCGRLLHFALNTAAVPRPPRPLLPGLALYNREEPLAEGYYFTEQTLLGNPDIQQLMASRQP